MDHFPAISQYLAAKSPGASLNSDPLGLVAWTRLGWLKPTGPEPVPSTPIRKGPLPGTPLLGYRVYFYIFRQIICYIIKM